MGPIRRTMASLFPVTFGGGRAVEPPPSSAVAVVPPVSKSIQFTGGDFIPRDGDGNTIDTGSRVLLSSWGGYTTSVLAHAAMRYRYTKLAEAPLWVAEESDDGEEWLRGHPLAELLQFPNEDEEMADVLEAVSLSLDRFGLALLVKDEDRAGRPGRLTCFRGDEFTVQPTPDRIYGQFRVATRLGQGLADGTEPLPPERVIFLRLPHPTDRWLGFGPLEVLSRQLRMERELLDSMLFGLQNAVVPGMTVTYPAEVQLNQDQVDEFNARLQVSYSRARKHGRPLTVGGGAVVTQNRLGFEGLSGGELYREIEAAVCVAFAVRPEILGMMIGLENSPWSHMQTAQRLAYDEGIIPQWRRIERAFTRQLLRPMDPSPNRKVLFDLTKIRALQDDATENARRATLLKGIATRNQRRQIAGLEPEKGEWWDEVEGKAEPVELPPSGLPPGSPAGAGGDDDDDESAVEERSRKNWWAGATLQWAEFDLSTKAASKVWKPTVARLLVLQSTDVRKLFRAYVREAGGVMTDESILRFLGEVGVYLTVDGARKAREILEPMIRSTAVTSSRRLAFRVGLGWDVVQPGLEDYIQNELTFLIAKMGETTGRAVALTVQRSTDARETIEQLRGRLVTLPEFSDARAALVARTETTRVTNGAQRRTAREMEAAHGVRMEKTWLSSRDQDVREEHQELDDGQWYDVDFVFANGLQAPGEPNCRCTLGYRLAEGGA